MKQKRRPKAILAKRFPVSFLSDVVYFEQPMPRELAEAVRTLRRDHGLSYSALMWALCESEPDDGQCFGYGKALVDRAVLELGDDSPLWK